ncbi:cell division ATP-binding protein FtsE [Brevundimonas sp. M20]|uniref:cell division ATP-binding protein FtsE n=1 Tax=Brevundimonas sp. M20 TaxID=2591463 RepID=UPI0011470397|nr:ATP-binding cassette domain-containing protein [Brevundimonas sp. M20]QDH74594.1 ATP-binding cassette domain-containing protein [Brevundimonas sp. M20]
MSVQPRRAADAASSPATARLRGVGFGYEETPDVLRDVNLILPAGSFHFLTGPSGAGKSTLLKLLTLDVRPREGTLELFGEEAGAAPRSALPDFRRRMGVVFQDFRLLDHLSAWENVALPLRLAGVKTADYADDVHEMLDWVGLGEKIDSRPAALSGGEKQRLAIARAVVTGPDLIIADEPTGNVDAAMAGRLLKLFQSMNRLGTTVLIASHDADLAARSGATVLTLASGRLTGGQA